jgi:hypothetical protein
MNALALSKQMYFEVGEPLLKKRFPDLFERMAIGLCGRGSQCLGLDDETSRDHGWGTQFFVFLTDEDYRTYGEDVNFVLAELPDSYLGYENRHRPTKAVSISEWFPWCLEAAVPVEPTDWLNIAENRLLEATNGEVWHDPHGEVSRTRAKLASYPDDIWRSRVASKIWQLTDSGAYNFPRAAKRGDQVTMSLALSRFQQQAMELCFLLNRSYAPYYKWLYACFSELPGVSPRLRSHVSAMSGSFSLLEKQKAVSQTLSELRAAVQKQFPETREIEPKDDFFDFWELSRALRNSITDASVREATMLKP